MIKAKLQRLEKKVKTLALDRENLPSAITIRVVGCHHPKPKKTVLSDSGAIPIFQVCKPGGGECESCEHYHPERLRT